MLYAIGSKVDSCPSDQLAVIALVDTSKTPYDRINNDTEILYKWVLWNTPVDLSLKLNKLTELPKGLAFHWVGAEVRCSMTIREDGKKQPVTYYLFKVK